MATGIHRYAYASARPVTPNTTLAPLGLAPGSTVTVYDTGTLTLASLFTDQALSHALGNPLTTDVNAFYQYFVDPSLGDLDEQFSGTGIPTPYTLSEVLNLDPRTASGGGSIATLTAALAAETAAREAADAAIIATGVRYPLGGSILEGIEGTGQQNVFNPITITVDGTKFAGYTFTIFVFGKTDNAGVSVTPHLYNLTTAATVGNGTAITSTSPVAQSFTATLAAGVNQYVLQMTPSANTAFVYLNGYCQLSTP